MARLKRQVIIDGKPTFISGYDKDDLIEKLVTIINDTSGLVVDVPTFSDYASTWLSTYKAKALKPTTYSNLCGYLRNHLLPCFGQKKVNQIDVASIQRFLNDRSQYARKTLKDILMWLRQILDSAKEDHFIKENPAESSRITIPSRKQTKRDALDAEDLADIVSHLNDLKPNDALFLAILMYTGMRRGEVLALRYSDFDLDNRLIHVNRNVTYPNQNRPIIGTPKSSAGCRYIPILAPLLPYLPQCSDDVYLFHDPEDASQPWSHQQFVNTWTRISKTVDLHGATPHIFRHTFITLCVASGADLKSCQQIAGHANASMTTDLYSHAKLMQIQQASHMIENCLLSQGTKKNSEKSRKPA